MYLFDRGRTRSYFDVSVKCHLKTDVCAGAPRDWIVMDVGRKRIDTSQARILSAKKKRLLNTYNQHFPYSVKRF